MVCEELQKPGVKPRFFAGEKLGVSGYTRNADVLQLFPIMTSSRKSALGKDKEQTGF